MAWSETFIHAPLMVCLNSAVLSKTDMLPWEFMYFPYHQKGWKQFLTNSDHGCFGPTCFGTCQWLIGSRPLADSNHVIGRFGPYQWLLWAMFVDGILCWTMFLVAFAIHNAKIGQCKLLRLIVNMNIVIMTGEPFSQYDWNKIEKININGKWNLSSTCKTCESKI